MKKILLVILGMFLLGFIFNEITGEKFPIGSTTLHDSTSVFTVNNNVKVNGTMQSNYLKVGSTSPEFYMKEIRYVTGGVGTNAVMLHGVTDYRKIISYEASVRDAATGIQVGANSWTGTYQFLARIDSTYLKTFIAAGSTDIANDTVTYLLKIKK